MDWKEWAETYPCRVIDKIPTSSWFQGENYIEAVNISDKLEEFNDIACEVVKFLDIDIFYVIPKGSS